MTATPNTLILPVSFESHEASGTVCEVTRFDDGSRATNITADLMGDRPNLMVTLPGDVQVLDESWPTVRYPFTRRMMEIINAKYEQTGSLKFLADAVDYPGGR
ncbi:MAG TPA: hypothetical protein VLA92_01035 [Candidatus Saccharimonadales bacterium]|nr:hypothetical protein [Candidatus Saccharimonadales bacterium]